MGKTAGLDRNDVVTAALDLVEREGPGALTMRRLATDLAVATPTIYWHAGSRDELVAEVVRAQSRRFAERPVEGTTPRARVLSAAMNMYLGSIEHRAITSLAHQSGTASVLAHPLEVAIVAELEAAGLTGEACAEASRAILMAITGALVLALRDPSRIPAEHRPANLWAGSDAAVSAETRAALGAEADLDAIARTTISAVVDHFVPARARSRRGAA